MPLVSPRQARVVRACAHRPRHLQGRCPDATTVREFIRATGSTRSRPERAPRRRGRAA